MTEYKKCEVVRLPTEDKTDVWENTKNKNVWFAGNLIDNEATRNDGKYQHLYVIISKVEIGAGEYYLSKGKNYVSKNEGGGALERCHSWKYHKIIASTDKSLTDSSDVKTTTEGEDFTIGGWVKHMPKIPQQLTEDYCKNPVNELMVGYEVINTDTAFFNESQRNKLVLKLTNNEIHTKPIDTCKHIKREGESCTKNNNCTYPNCEMENCKKCNQTTENCECHIPDEVKHAGLHTFCKSVTEEKMYTKSEVEGLIAKFSDHIDSKIDYDAIAAACCSIPCPEWDEKKWIKDNL